MNRTTIITSAATFAVGLLTGALVFSQSPPTASDEPNSSAPKSVLPEDNASNMAPETRIAVVGEIEDADAGLEPGPDRERTPPEVEVLLARIDDISNGWGRMQAELAQLRQRIGQLEQQGSEPQATDGGADSRPSRPRTQEEQRDALLRAGVRADLAEDILWRRAQVSLEELDLRDQAAREGWLNTNRFRDEMRKINEQRVSIRDEIGVDAYDSYLFQTGQNNRVLVDSVIPGSAGEDSGMLPGDVIERYGELPVYDFRDLRDATSDGERDELVPVIVRRSGERVELLLPRGPIGIGLDATRLDPRG
ncbi:MAG: PDZ domain-containing protein [Thiohalocapsa sp.]